MIAKQPYMGLINVCFAFLFLFVRVIRKRLLCYFISLLLPVHIIWQLCAHSTAATAATAVALGVPCVWVLGFCVCLCNPNLVFNYFSFSALSERCAHIFIGSFARWPLSIVASFSWVRARCVCAPRHTVRTRLSSFVVKMAMMTFRIGKPARRNKKTHTHSYSRYACAMCTHFVSFIFLRFCWLDISFPSSALLPIPNCKCKWPWILFSRKWCKRACIWWCTYLVKELCATAILTSNSSRFSLSTPQRVHTKKVKTEEEQQNQPAKL